MQNTSDMTSEASSVELIVRATNFAAIAHRTQLRKDGSTPYINHPIGVASILTELGKITDANVIAAALLHDTVEDCDVTFEQIQQEFGEQIWFANALLLLFAKD